jgi:alpha-galactosidase
MRGICVLLACLVVVDGRNNGLGRLPPLGWNTWCTWSSCHQDNKSLTHAYHDVCTEDMVKDVAQSMIDQGLQKAGYYMVNLDDCWEGAWSRVVRTCLTFLILLIATTRDPKTGAMRADPDRFPSGSLKPLADWLHARNFSFGMYTSAGNETCSTGGRTIPGKPGSRGVDGSWGHYEQDAKTYADWGIDYVRPPHAHMQLPCSRPSLR